MNLYNSQNFGLQMDSRWGLLAVPQLAGSDVP